MSRAEIVAHVLYLLGSACFFAGTLIVFLLRGCK